MAREGAVFVKSKKTPISRQIVDFLDLCAPVAYAPAEIMRHLKISQEHVEAVRVALQRAVLKREVVHEAHGMYRSATVEPRDLCRCPRCRRSGLRKYVEVTVEAPAQCRALDKQGIRSPDVAVVAALWERERFFCRKCGWNSRRGARS